MWNQQNNGFLRFLLINNSSRNTIERIKKHQFRQGTEQTKSSKKINRNDEKEESKNKRKKEYEKDIDMDMLHMESKQTEVEQQQSTKRHSGEVSVNKR